MIGEQQVDSGEERWQFVPAEPWRNGKHRLIALTFLEDLAGNRIGRAFEVDGFRVWTDRLKRKP